MAYRNATKTEDVMATEGVMETEGEMIMIAEGDSHEILTSVGQLKFLAFRDHFSIF